MAIKHDLGNDIIDRHYFTSAINGTNFMSCVEVEILEKVKGTSCIYFPG